MDRTLMLTKEKGKILSLLFQENRLIRANAYPEHGSDLESIYIGKVKNMVPSLEAAFVEYKPETIGFLPMKQVKNPVLTNRTFDGRLIVGDELVVQVEKEGIKNKPPGLTCNLSFTGKYCVLTTGKKTLGFSNKLSLEQKERLKGSLLENRLEERLAEEGVGMVVRTNAGQLENLQPLLEEITTLLEEKNRLLQTACHRICFSLLQKTLAPYLAGIRDLYSYSYDKILTDDETMFKEIQQTFGEKEKLFFYQDEVISLSRLYQVETRLKEALGEKVWLSSGAYLVIQPTEALTVIDVNSGKYQKKAKEQDTFYQINREAAKEIALQLKLRNLSGIIIIDFINQNSQEQDKELLQYLTKLVKEDSVQTKVMGMTALGLVEVTRKKISPPLWAQLKA
ncbi:MAG: ribonuclease E/G [Lachnospiraceae bacterium]